MMKLFKLAARKPGFLREGESLIDFVTRNSSMSRKEALEFIEKNEFEIQEAMDSGWPICDQRGCYRPAKIDKKAALTFGENLQPHRKVIEGEDHYFCGSHF